MTSIPNDRTRSGPMKIIEHQCTIGSGGLKSVALTKGGLVGLRPRYPEIGKKMFVIFQV